MDSFRSVVPHQSEGVVFRGHEARDLSSAFADGHVENTDPVRTVCLGPDPRVLLSFLGSSAVRGASNIAELFVLCDVVSSSN